MMIYRSVAVTPEVISKLHRGLYFVIKLDGDKTVNSDFVMKNYVYKLDDIKEILLPVLVTDEEQKYLWDSIAEHMHMSAEHGVLQNYKEVLQKDYIIIKREK